jgi:5-methylcytosine-specific restriction endonuclease McrA
MRSWRHAPLPKGWYKTRLRILKRDGHRCTHIRYDTDTRCPEIANQVDHIDPLGPETDDNLTSLCWFHHKQKSSAEGGAAVHKKANQKTKPHPGQIRP